MSKCFESTSKPTSASANLCHYTVWNWLRYFIYAKEKALEDYSVKGESAWLARCERLLLIWEMTGFGLSRSIHLATTGLNTTVLA
jgi:hypothetical protein